MPKHANAHLVLNSRDRILPGSTGVYNNFNLTNQGQNVIQGQMKDIALSEVLFPYDIPNIMPGFNEFELLPTTPDVLTIIIKPGFYTGTELAAAVTAEIIAQGAAAPGPVGPFAPGDLPTCVYDAVSNRFTFTTPTNPAFAQEWSLASPYVYASNYLGVATPALGKDILSIMGFPGNDPTGQIGTVAGAEIAVGDSAPLLFTQYIDICSPKLCQYQFIRDGSTTTLPRRVDLICRLYVADENSVPLLLDASGEPFVAGTRPFVIHRQFQNQRVMRWTASNAVGGVDIQLYDDVGQPLPTAWGPRNFQLSFHVYEADDGKSDANIGYRY